MQGGPDHTARACYAVEERVAIGTAEVKAVFGSGNRRVAGCMVTDGALRKGCIIQASAPRRPRLPAATSGRLSSVAAAAAVLGGPSFYPPHPLLSRSSLGPWEVPLPTPPAPLPFLSGAPYRLQAALGHNRTSCPLKQPTQPQNPNPPASPYAPSSHF